MAAPHASGLAALIMSYASALARNAITDVMIATADDKGTTGWDPYFGWGRINAHAALQAAVAWPRIVGSVPPDGSIDARAPHELDDSAARFGWMDLDLTFEGAINVVDAGGFAVSQQGGVAGTPVVATVQRLATDRVKVTLDERLEPSAWTTVTHLDSQTSVRLGFLPGDVNGDGISATDDVTALMDYLGGVGDPRELWSVDIDHTLNTQPADLLRLIDLLNGAGAFDPYLDVSLP